MCVFIRDVCVCVHILVKIHILFLYVLKDHMQVLKIHAHARFDNTNMCLLPFTYFYSPKHILITFFTQFTSKQQNNKIKILTNNHSDTTLYITLPYILQVKAYTPAVIKENHQLKLNVCFRFDSLNPHASSAQDRK